MGRDLPKREASFGRTCGKEGTIGLKGHSYLAVIDRKLLSKQLFVSIVSSLEWWRNLTVVLLIGTVTVSFQTMVYFNQRLKLLAMLNMVSASLSRQFWTSCHS